MSSPPKILYHPLPRPEHNPVGDPCLLCHARARTHRVRHAFVGRNKQRCTTCGLPLANHQMTRAPDTRERTARVYAKRAKAEPLFLGIDGEGQGREKHRYVFLAAADESGTQTFSVENEEGLSTEECLTFLYTLPTRARLFAFSFGYDLTKMLQTMTETHEGRRALWYLMRPEKRQRLGVEAAKGPYPVLWKGWSLNLQGTKFSFGRTGLKKPGRRRILWDIWKFYQSKFTKALDDWKAGSEAERAVIAYMKDHRHEFDQQPKAEVQKYCFLECQKMAELARKLIDAHREAGLPLKTFYGAGSTATVMLKHMGVKRHIAEAPEAMRDAIAAAFSGGRFELSHIGSVKGNVDGWDISSAYPYQLCQLPCLVHGHWEHISKRSQLDNAQWALVRYALGPVREVPAWGPFPFRFPRGHKEQGSICYPITSGGGWTYLPEYLAGERLFPNVQFVEAWTLKTECECMPFQKIPLHYIERCRIGKEGPGIVLKLGCNSCYGKVAQSVGKGQFNCWVWAGMITSGCRAQGLDLLGLHKDWSKLLMFATDGLLTTETIVPPAPLETGTGQTGKPLGGWENKAMKKGVFLGRPGVYFPLHPTEDEITTIRGRGIGRGAVLNHWEKIVRTWEKRKKGEWPTVELDSISRFCGAKTSTTRVKRNGEYVYRVARGKHLEGRPSYGEWIDRTVEMSFDPRPKRIGRKDGTLEVRQLPQNLESAPYDRAVLSAEAKELITMAAMLAEQPNGDLLDYDATES